MRWEVKSWRRLGRKSVASFGALWQEADWNELNPSLGKVPPRCGGSFDGTLDAGGEAVELTHEVREEVGGDFKNVFDTEAHGLVEEELHLKKSQLLVDEADFGWNDWFN